MNTTPPIPAGMPAASTLFTGNWLRLQACGHWEYAERMRASGAVVIAALTPGDEVLFVEQFRVPVAQWTIEMPAGLVGDLADARDESVLLAAARELEEETGWRPARVEFLHAGPSSAGMSNEIISFVRAHELRKPPRTSVCTRCRARRRTLGSWRRPPRVIRSIPNYSPGCGFCTTAQAERATRSIQPDCSMGHQRMARWLGDGLGPARQAHGRSHGREVRGRRRLQAPASAHAGAKRRLLDKLGSMRQQDLQRQVMPQCHAQHGQHHQPGEQDADAAPERIAG